MPKRNNKQKKQRKAIDWSGVVGNIFAGISMVCFAVLICCMSYAVYHFIIAVATKLHPIFAIGIGALLAGMVTQAIAREL